MLIVYILSFPALHHSRSKADILHWVQKFSQWTKQNPSHKHNYYMLASVFRGPTGSGRLWGRCPKQWEEAVQTGLHYKGRCSSSSWWWCSWLPRGILILSGYREMTTGSPDCAKSSTHWCWSLKKKEHIFLYTRIYKLVQSINWCLRCVIILFRYTLTYRWI